MQTIAERLAWARVQAALDRRELARIAGLGSETHVGLIESGDRPDPRGSTLKKLALALGVSFGWLAAGEGDIPSAETIRAAIERARSKHNAAVAAVA